MDVKIDSIKDFDYKGKTVLLRLDINSPIDPMTKKIINENRIDKSIPTLKYLLSQGAKVAIIAHQGDTLDYHNLIPMAEHAHLLAKKLNREVEYIDDVCGPAAQWTVKNLKPGEAVLLGNLRYLTEEVSTFENAVKLQPEDMTTTYLVRSLAPLVDCYVNDAFSAAHRNCPSMVAFQELLPSAAGFLLLEELEALYAITQSPKRPMVFALGGLKISDAFGMMRQVLEKGIADKVLCSGVVGEIMLLAKGYSLGSKTEGFIKERSLDDFIEPAKRYLENFPEKIIYPLDLAYEKNGQRQEIDIKSLPADFSFLDIGHKTIKLFEDELAKAGTIFTNGPAGVYENEIFQEGTKALFKAISDAKGYTLIGGGDTVNAAERFIDLNKINYVCTAGGAMVRFLSGEKMPLIEAMEKGNSRKNS